VEAAEVVAVVAAAAGAVDAAVAGAAAPAPLFAPQPLAEQEACPVAPGAVLAAGATSLACTGCGWLPPQATMALVPSAARTAAKFSNDRFGRMTVLSS
jgi:hypothetical protein